MVTEINPLNVEYSIILKTTASLFHGKKFQRKYLLCSLNFGRSQHFIISAYDFI